jgi:FkbM family methyltransferase
MDEIMKHGYCDGLGYGQKSRAGATSVGVSSRVSRAIKDWFRPFVLPGVHGWQWLHDYCRRKLPGYRDRRRLLRDGTAILKDVHGTRFVLYPWDRRNLLDMVSRIYDATEFQVIPRLVKHGDVAFDVGAHAGIYSVLLSRLCGSSGRVHAFEPVHDTYWRLRETLALNRCDNVVPVEKAVCNRDGVVQMNLFEAHNSEWNSLGTPMMDGPNGTRVSPSFHIEVGAVTLDQFCSSERIERIHFLKVDVEGFELAVFQGADRLLREHRIDCICFEISKEPLRGAGVESRQVFKILADHGYLAYRFDGSLGRFQGPIHDTSESWANFFASRADLSDPP